MGYCIMNRKTYLVFNKKERFDCYDCIMIREKAFKKKTANKIKVWHPKVYNGVTNLLIV